MTDGSFPASYQLPATSYQLPATSYQLPATSHQLPATSYRTRTVLKGLGFSRAVIARQRTPASAAEGWFPQPSYQRPSQTLSCHTLALARNANCLAFTHLHIWRKFLFSTKQNQKKENADPRSLLSHTYANRKEHPLRNHTLTYIAGKFF